MMRLRVVNFRLGDGEAFTLPKVTLHEFSSICPRSVCFKRSQVLVKSAHRSVLNLK